MAFRVHRFPPIIEPPEAPVPAVVPALAQRGAPEALSLLRIVAALLYWQHGLQKVINFPPSPRGPMPFVLD